MVRPKKAVNEGLARPLALPIGGKILLGKKKFQGLKDKKIPIKYPGKENILKSYGHMHRFGDNRNLFNEHRYYLYGDICPNGRPQESFIQISVDENNQVKKCYLYRVFDELFPISEHEWDTWLNRDNGRLGAKDYTHEGLKIPFHRTWEKESSGRVEPWFYEEFCWSNEKSIGDIKSSNLIASQCMLYHHDLDHSTPKTELALLMAVEEHLQDTSIKVYLGLKLDFKKDLKVSLDE